MQRVNRSNEPFALCGVYVHSIAHSIITFNKLFFNGCLGLGATQLLRPRRAMATTHERIFGGELPSAGLSSSQQHQAYQRYSPTRVYVTYEPSKEHAIKPNEPRSQILRRQVSACVHAHGPGMLEPVRQWHVGAIHNMWASQQALTVRLNQAD